MSDEVVTRFASRAELEDALARKSEWLDTANALLKAADRREVALRAEVARLREALKWYADARCEKMIYCANETDGAIELDNGARARTALGEDGKDG